MKRDIAERGRSVDDVLHQYLFTVKPAFDEFIAPVSPHSLLPLACTASLSPSAHSPSPLTSSLSVQTKRYADIIIPRGGENLVAIDLLVQHIKRQLRKRGVQAAASAHSTHPPPTYHIPAQPVPPPSSSSLSSSSSSSTAP